MRFATPLLAFALCALLVACSADKPTDDFDYGASAPGSGAAPAPTSGGDAAAGADLAELEERLASMDKKLDRLVAIHEKQLERIATNLERLARKRFVVEVKTTMAPTGGTGGDSGAGSDTGMGSGSADTGSGDDGGDVGTGSGDDGGDTADTSGGDSGGDGSDGLALFKLKVKADAFNDAVKDGTATEPVPGGELRIRTPSFPKGLNRHIQSHNTAGRTTINSYMFSDLIRQDPETLEYQPLAAKYWTVQDVVDLLPEDGKETDKTEYKRRYGRLVKVVDGKHVVLLEGAVQATVAAFECKGVPELKVGERVDGKITLDTGETFTGEIYRVGEHTLQIEDTANAKEVTIPWAQIAKRSWTLGEGDGAKKMPGVRKNCLYVFQIRKGINWHDGKPYTAEDIDFTFNGIVRNDHVPAPQLRANWVDCESVKAIDSHKVRFEWKKPFFSSLSYSGQLSVVAKHRVWRKEYTGDEKAFGLDYAKHKDNDSPCGQGPYKFVEWDRNDRLSIARNEDWFARKVGFPYISKQQPYLDKIHWIKISEALPAMQAMKAGDVDLDLDVEPATWQMKDANARDFTGRFVRAWSRNPGYTYIGWNMRKPKFQNPLVRRALAMLINREVIAKVVHKGLAEPVSGPFFPLSPACDTSIPPYPYNPRKAKALLARCGIADLDGDRWLDWRNPETGKVERFRFEYAHHNARAYHSRIAVKVKEAMAAAGIEVTLKSLDWNVFSDYAQNRKFDAIRFAWTATVDPDPYQIWHSSQSAKGSNYVAYKNARVDEICEIARITFDDRKRWSLLREMHRHIHDDAPYTFMFLFRSLSFYSKDLRGVKFYTSRWDSVDLSEWYIPKKLQAARKKK